MCLRLVRIGPIDTLSHVGKDLLGSEHAVGIESRAIVVAVCIVRRATVGSRPIAAGQSQECQ